MIALGVLPKNIHFKRLVQWLSYSEFDSDKQKAPYWKCFLGVVATFNYHSASANRQQIVVKDTYGPSTNGSHSEFNFITQTRSWANKLEHNQLLRLLFKKQWVQIWPFILSFNL